MDTRTRRQSIRRLLELSMDGVTPEELRNHVFNEYEENLSTQQALDEVQHIRRSLRNEDATLLVRPPACNECEFDGFDDPVNVPSRCPNCRSEWISDPAFMIRDE